jgi:hypothetical protein
MRWSRFESKLIDIAAQIIGETDKAYLLFDGTRQVWLPKSIVEYDARRKLATIPDWAARDKKLI